MKFQGFILLLLSFFLTSVFSEKSKVLDEKNIYNGKTIETTYTLAEREKIAKQVDYFDSMGQVLRVDFQTRETLRSETGIELQSMYFDDSGQIDYYELFYTRDYYSIHGINRVLEYVDENDHVEHMEWYIDDEKVDFLDDYDTATRYPFYKLSFLQSVMFEEEYESSAENTYNISAKYRGIRTVVTCNGTIESLTEKDKDLISAIGHSLGSDTILEYYSSKMMVEEDGVQYCMYIQNGLEKYLPKEEKTTIRYYFMGYNEKLYILLMVLTNL